MDKNIASGFLCGLLLFSVPSIASTEVNGPYIHGKFGLMNNISRDDQDSGEVSLPLSFSAGYDIYLDTTASLGFEAEYSYFEASAPSSANTDFDSKAQSVGITFKPKITIWDSPVYVAPYIGYLFSKFKSEFKTTNNGSTTKLKSTDSLSGMQYGVDFGYQFVANWALSAGYNIKKFDDSGVDIEVKGINFGVLYQF